jgi:hypothetical protein
MDCPECGGSLDAYVLGGREAVTCARCGWVGIEADHRGEPGVDESWGEALGRFYERHVETTRRPDLPPVAASVGEESGADEDAGSTDETSDDGRDGAASDEAFSGEGAPGRAPSGEADGVSDERDAGPDPDDPDADDGPGGVEDEKGEGAAPADDEAIRPE